MRVLYKFSTILIIINVLLIGACEKVTYDKPKAKDVVKFAEDIQPIFNNKCISCHSGTQKPDLRDGKSYSALKNGVYFNVTTPSESKIYLKLTTSESHKPKANDLEKSTILRWIELGANND